MKYKLLRFSLLSMLVMFFGGLAYADQVTMKYSGSTTANMTGENDAALLGLDANAWSVVGDKGANSNMPGLNKAGDIRLYWSANGSNTITVQSLAQKTINSIAITFTGESYSNVSVTVEGNAVTGTNGVFDINSTSFVLGNANTSNVQVRISEIVITYGEVTTDTRTATTVTLGEHQTSGEVGTTMSLPSVSVSGADGAPIANAVVTWTSSNEEVATINATATQINLLTAGTTTISASFAGDNTYKPSSASFTLTVQNSKVAVGSFSELQSKVTATSTPATITFNGEQVVFVNGNNAFLADANGYGALVYTKNHGLEAGQTLTGTIDASIVLYQGNAEITNFSNEGLTIGTAEVVPVVKTVGEIAKANQSTLVTLKNVTYNAEAKTFADATGATITFYDKFKTGVELADGKTYDVTGIVVLYNETIEICPRTADDVAEAQAEPANEGSAIFSWEGNAEGAIVTGGTVTATDATGADLTADDVNIGNSGNYVIRLRGAKDFSTNVVNIALDKALKAGDKIAITAYRNKNAEGKQSGALLKFEKGETTVSTATNGGLEFVNINEAVQGTAEYGTEPNTITLTVPQDADGSKTIAMTRAVTATNLFITKIEITGERSGDEPIVEPSGWADIKADFTNGSFFTANETSVTTAGLKMNADGTFTRVAADDETANAVITGKYHSNEHGLANFSAQVKVEGPVKVSMGTCAWGGDVTIKDATGATVGTFNTNNGACYHNDKENNIASTFYKGEATTLTISGGSYTPYFAVEAVDPATIPSDCKISFDIANAGAEGVAPADVTAEIGSKFTVPQNFTLYKAGYTLTAWTNGESTWAVGEEMTVPEAEALTLLPVFTENMVNLADRTESVTVKFDFQKNNGAPSVQWQNQDNLVWVAQASVNGVTIDVPTHFSTNPGKFNNSNWGDWCQINSGTKFTIPSCKGAVVSVEAYNELSELTIDGQNDYTSAKTISYEIAGSAETVDVVFGSEGSYYRYIQVVLPVVQSQGGGESYDNATASIEWPFNDPATISSYTAQPEGAFSTVAVNTGDLEITGAATRSADDLASGVTFIKLKPSGETKAVQWVAKPAAGLTFTPTKVSMWIQRFGTDSENGVTITAKVGEGEAVTLGTFTAPRANKNKNDDKFGSNSNWTNHVEIELTAEQQAALTSGEELVLSATVGVSNTKEGGFSDVIIEGLVNGTKADVSMYTLATAVAPEEAGSVNVYPMADEYEEGSEVTLTATENFGYDFVNWTNAAGQEVSTEAKFKYTVTGNETLTANFVAVETYELALTVDGTNDYMVTVSPEPTVIDGKWMYEAGTAVQLNANQYEGLVTFTNWSDGETASSKLISMDGDIQITAMYAEADIIAGWDFYKAGSNGRKADFAAQDNDADALNLVETATGETSGWLDKSWLGAGGYESFKGAAVNWRTGTKNGDVGNWHWQTKINAEAFTDINVQFQMLYNYNAYQTYNAEYSLDGENWTKFGSITMTGAKQVAQFNEQMPAEVNNQKDLYIRMLADKTSQVDGAASANDGNTLAMFFITGTPKLVDDGKAPMLVSTVPENGATGASASGKIVLTFDERVKVKEGAVAYINDVRINSNTQNPTTPTVSGKTVTFEYKSLEYSTEYSFNLPANTVADLTDNYIAEPIALTFTTMTRPSIDKKMYDYVVDNVDDLVKAIAAAQARSDKNTRYRIFVKNGEYTIPLKSTMKTVNGYEVPECITFINTQNLSLIGESRDGVIITNGIDKNETFAGTYGTTSKYDGIGNSDVFQISGSDYYFQDLTIESGMDDATGRDLAVQDKATRTIYKNTGLRGYQDTWTSNNDNGLYYFEGGYVRGRTDYMCGKGDAFFNGVEIRQIYGGYAAVPSKSIKYGYTYKDCVINGEPGIVSGKNYSAAEVDGNYTLGRPWGSGTPVALWIDTKMNVVPSAIGWNEMSGGWPKRFAEFNSMTSTGSVIDLSGRKKVFGDGHENNPVLTAEEAMEAGNLHNMFGEWDPTLLTEQAPMPASVEVNKDTKVLTWTDSDYALLYAIVKNGKVVDFTLTNSYNVDDVNATWAVRAANEMGGLGEAAAASIVTAITETINAENNVPERIYNLNGVRVDKAAKGLYIINGKKVVVK